MNASPFDDVRPGGRLSARELNRAFDRLDSISDVGGGGTIGASDEFGQILIYDQSYPKTKIRILSGTNPYAWEEVYQTAVATWEATGVRSGTVDNLPAVELTGNASVAAGTVVDAYFDLGPDFAGQWNFTATSSGLTSLVKSTKKPPLELTETAGPVTSSAVKVFSRSGLTLGVDDENNKGLMLVPWATVSKGFADSPYQARVRDCVLVNLSAGHVEIKVPVSDLVEDDAFRIAIVAGSGTNHVTLSSADAPGKSIAGQAEPYVGLVWGATHAFRIWEFVYKSTPNLYFPLGYLP